MMTPAGFFGRVVDRVHHHDPEYDALRRAIRAAIVLPAVAGISLAVGNSEQLLTILGSYALLVLVDFPGDRPARALAYAGLGLNGAVLITLGTLAAPVAWLGVALMFAIGMAIIFSGVISATFAAGQRATLWALALPLCTPAGPIGDRLFAWLIALLVSVPAALFVFPPRHHDALRRHAAQMCTVLADRLEGAASSRDVTTAMDALQANFLATQFRPVGLSAGSRALVRVVDDLEWLSDRINQNTGRLLSVMEPPAVRVLRASARVLEISRAADLAAGCAELSAAVHDLRSASIGSDHDNIIELFGAASDDAAMEVRRKLLYRRTVAATIGVTGQVIGAAAAADARPVWARVLGRQLPKTRSADRVLSETAAAAVSTTGFWAVHSVIARNSLRTGLGLALAVAITHLVPVQHGFWVVLGVLSVLSSSALTTGANVLRAVAGTAIGIVFGTAVIIVVGFDPIVLWILLPVATFGSAYIAKVASFAAGQAAFTMLLLITFNLIAPTGWRVGLVRIEDVVVGCLACIVVSLLLWPRGATAAVSAAITASREVCARYLLAVVLGVTRGASEGNHHRVIMLSHQALTASRTMDDAVRQYLSESGGETYARAPVIRAFNQVVRLWSVADAIAGVTTMSPVSAYPRARAVLETRAEWICERPARVVDDDETRARLRDEFVLALRAETTGTELDLAAAVPLVTVAGYLAELELIYPKQATAIPVRNRRTTGKGVPAQRLVRK